MIKYVTLYLLSLFLQLNILVATPTGRTSTLLQSLASSRFVPITPKAAVSALPLKNSIKSKIVLLNDPDKKKFTSFFSSIMSGVNPRVRDQLWDPQINMGTLNINDFPHSWHSWMFLLCDPNVLNTASGFDLPRPPSNIEQPKRSQRTYKYLDPSYVPASFEGDTIKTWVMEYKKEFKKYKEGTGHLPRFFYDLLRRKVKAILMNLPASDQILYENDMLEICEKGVEVYSLNELAAYFFIANKALGASAKRDFVYYPAPNGVPITAIYEKGVLKQVYTQALGVQKDLIDIVTTVKLPKTTLAARSIKVEGYLYLDATSLDSINAERRNQGLRDWVDSYSAVADALMRSDEPNRSLELKLKCIFDDFEYLDIENRHLSKKEQFSRMIKENIPTVEDSSILIGSNKLGMAFIPSPKALPFEMLGYKISLNDNGEQKLFGLQDVIVKFAPEFQRTKVENIKFEVLSNGCILAVIHTVPVIFGSSSYNIFTISNETHLYALNIQVGDDIDVMFNLGSTPRVYKSYANGDKDFPKYPKECPQCLNNLSRKRTDSDIIAYCAAHLKCKDESVDDIMRFSSVYGLHIPSLTEQLVKELKRKSKAFNYMDLMDLSLGGFNALESGTYQEYRQLLNEIRAAKQTTLPRLLFALNIPGVDYILSEKLATMFGSLQRLSIAKTADLCADNGVTPEVAKGIREWFSNPNSMKKIKTLLAKGVIVSEATEDILRLCYKPTFEQSDYKEIVHRINQYTHSHEVPDLEYDTFRTVADKIEAQHPDWMEERADKDPVNPTNIPKTIFKNEPVRYIGKTYALDEIVGLCQRLQNKTEANSYDTNFIVEPKVDGIACYLHYKEGKLVAAYTKKANMGNNITQLVNNVPSLPKQLKSRLSGVVRGELFVAKENFLKINEAAIQDGRNEYADSLSLLVGIINSKKETRFSVLSSIEIFPFWLVVEGDDKTSGVSLTPENVHEFLKNLGFSSSIKVPFVKISTIEAVKAYAKNAAERRFEQPVNIDGIVIKLSSSEACVACAYKFNRETRSSEITSVDFFLTKNRGLQAVANIKPLYIGNREVSRVYIHNPSVLSNAHFGDTISIHYAAGSSPIFNGIKHAPSKKTANDNLKIKLPESCPSCSAQLSDTNGYLKCKNPRCGGEEKKQANLMRFAKRMEIVSLTVSTSWIRELIAKGAINTFGDFFRLTHEDIVSKTTLDYQKAKIVLSQIDRASTSTKASFLRRLIPSVNIKEGVLVVLFDKLSDPLELTQKSIQELVAYGMSKRQARKMYEYIQNNRSDLIFCLRHLKPSNTTDAISGLKGVEKISSGFRHREEMLQKSLMESLRSLEMITQQNKQEVHLLAALDPADPQDKKLLRECLKIVQGCIIKDQKLLNILESRISRSDEVKGVISRMEEYISLRPKYPVLNQDTDNEEDDFYLADDPTSDDSSAVSNRDDMLKSRNALHKKFMRDRIKKGKVKRDCTVSKNDLVESRKKRK